MTITTATNYDVINAETFVQPLADENPLKTILENSNWLYMNHSPPLLSCVYTIKETDPRASQQFTVGTDPSADGLHYEFRHIIYTAAAGGSSVTVLVEAYYSSAWNSVYTQATSGVAGDNILVTNSAVLPAAATALRITFSTSGTDYRPLSTHIRPKPTSLAAGIKPSGFNPFDDGLLTATKAPLTTEHINRVKANAVAVVKDRKQCVLSFVQHNTLASALHDGEGHTVSFGTDNPVTMTIGHGKAALHGQKKEKKVKFYCLASHEAADADDKVRVTEVQSGNLVKFDPNNTLQSRDLTVVSEYPEFRVTYRNHDVGAGNDKLCVHSVVGLWEPTE